MAEPLAQAGQPLDVHPDRFMVDTNVEGWVEKAKRIFDLEGFVALQPVLSAEGCTEVLEACRRTEADMLKYDTHMIGCRDVGRYSFGAASKSGHMLYVDEWAHLLDAEKVLDVVDAIYGGSSAWSYSGGGGDFVRGETLKFQGLHSDLGPGRVPKDQQRRLPAPKIAVNFAVEDLSWQNGPMRIVPGRRVLTNRDQPPAFLDEPSADELGTVALQPLQMGAAVIRDLRVWHSGTPNLGQKTRFLPNVELCSAEYAMYVDDAGHTLSQTSCSVCRDWKCAIPEKERAKILPEAIYAKLSPRTRPHCHRIVACEGARIPEGIRPNFAKLQETWKKGKGSGKDKGKGSGKDKGKRQNKRRDLDENLGAAAPKKPKAWL